MRNEAGIIALVQSDPDATAEEKKRVLKALSGAENKPRPIPITTKEAAGLLGVHVVTLRRYEKAGLLKPMRYTARRIRWDRTAVERLKCEGVQS